MPSQHKMSIRRGLPAHGTRGSSHVACLCSRSAATGSATASSSTSPRYPESRAKPFLAERSGGSAPALAIRHDGQMTDDPSAAADPFAAAAASADRLTALAGPHDAAVVLGSGWTPAAA